MRNRSPGTSRQLTDLVTSQPSRAQSPGGLINFQQAFADVNEYGEDWGPSTSFTDGNFQTWYILHLDIKTQHLRHALDFI